MTAAAVAVLLAGCAGLVGVDPVSARVRLRRLSSAPPRRGRPAGLATPADRPLDGVLGRGWFLRCGVVVVAVLVLAERLDLGVPAAVALVAAVLPARRRAATAARRSALLAHDLPRASDLTATCLDAGCAPADALRIVCHAVGGPMSDALLPVVAALQMGIDPAVAWDGAVGGTRVESAALADEPMRRLVRAVARASATGAPLAETLRTLADDERERLRWTAEAAARRAGVRAVGPVAVCFLPAFLLLGVVPVVVGVATDVLGPLS